MNTGSVSARRRGAWLDIDLSAVTHNVQLIGELVGPSVELAAVVKADAYGHGLAPVARELDGHVGALCVATLDEGMSLRDAGISGRIIVLYPVPLAAVTDAADVGLELTLMSSGDGDAAITAARSRSDAAAPMAVHIAVETGFNRGGLLPLEVSGLAGRLVQASGLRLVGVWSHLASPEDAEAASRQLDIFERTRSGLREQGIDVAGHVASSSGTFLRLAPDLPMIRPGLALYGELDPSLTLDPAASIAAARLRPAMALKARPIAMSTVPAGGRVGYGGTWQAQQAATVATLPVGYGDGFARASQPDAEALVRGVRVPIVGVVSMDSVGVDVSAVPGVDIDDEFVLLGAQGGERITATDLARQRTTIAWEVLTGMAPRLGRVYHRRAEPTLPGSGP